MIWKETRYYNLSEETDLVLTFSFWIEVTTALTTTQAEWWEWILQRLPNLHDKGLKKQAADK
jgi:hypothetical protein